MCIDTRCPETMWLIQNPRPNITNNNESRMHDNTTIANPSTESTPNNHSQITTTNSCSKVLKANQKNRRLRINLKDKHHAGHHWIVTMVISVIVMIIYMGKAEF